MLAKKPLPGDADEAKKSGEQILDQQIAEEVAQIERTSGALFLSSLSAGFELGFSVFLMGVMLTLAGDDLPASVVALLVASVYSIGYIFVILGRSELFTEHTTQAVLPVLDRQASVRDLVRLWAIIYIANQIGGIVFAAVAAWLGPALHVIEPPAFGIIAGYMMGYPWWATLMGGLLAGWMMGLLSWLVSAGRDTISQVVCVFIVTFAIGLAHLQHSIAGAIELWVGLFAGQGVAWSDVGSFLVWATLGNAIGGVVFVAFFKYGQVARE